MPKTPVEMSHDHAGRSSACKPDIVLSHLALHAPRTGALVSRAMQACNAGAHARETEQEHDESTALSRIADASHLDWILYRDAERRFLEYVHRAVPLAAEKLVAYLSAYGETECTRGSYQDTASSSTSDDAARSA